MDITLLIVSNLVTGAACTFLGAWLSMIALNLEFVRKKITEEDHMDHLDVPGGADVPRKKKRRLDRTDVLLSILIIGFIVTGVNQISIGSKTSATITCLAGYSNELADALDRRQDDNTAYQMSDAARDETLLILFDARTPAARAEAAKDLRQATVDKQEALEEVQNGRKDKSYPQAPRDVCK